MTRETLTKSPSGRVKRTPLNKRNKLSVKVQDPNYHYRIVNTTDSSGNGNRVNDFIAAGYEVDPDNNGNVGDKRVDAANGVGSTPEFSVGQGKKAVVMRIKREWYEEDQAEKMAELKAQEDTMYENARRQADYGIVSKEGFQK